MTSRSISDGRMRAIVFGGLAIVSTAFQVQTEVFGSESQSRQNGTFLGNHYHRKEHSRVIFRGDRHLLMAEPVEINTTYSSYADALGHFVNYEKERSWQFVREMPSHGYADANLWPYPAKVGVVIGLFIVFEYLLDLLSFVSQDWNLAPVGTSANRQHQEEADRQKDPTLKRRLTVLTLNIWMDYCRENCERQIDAIRDLAPDVICLQEVFHLDVLEAYRTAFPDYCFVAFGRAHNASAVAFFCFLMCSTAACFSGAVWAVEKYVTDGMWKTVWLIAVPMMFAAYSHLIRHNKCVAFLTGNRTGLAMLVKKETVEIKERQCVPFTREGHAADWLNIFRPRGYISVVGLVRLPGELEALKVRFVTTHLNQPLEQALGDGRHRQIKEVFQRSLQEDEFCVFGCDLNATPPGTENGSACNSYSDVVAEMTDAWSEVNPSDPNRDGLTWDQSGNPMTKTILNKVFYGVETIRWRCDYIFWRLSTGSPFGATAADRREDGPADGPDDVPAQAEKGTKNAAVKMRTCDLVFAGKEAVSDHYGVHAVFDVHSKME